MICMECGFRLVRILFELNGVIYSFYFCEVCGKGTPVFRIEESQRCEVSSDYKRIVHARDIVCRQCGTSSNLTVHHIIPKAHGGPNTPENCILLCRNCHKRLHESEGYPSSGKSKGKKKRKKKKQLVKGGHTRPRHLACQYEYTPPFQNPDLKLDIRTCIG